MKLARAKLLLRAFPEAGRPPHLAPFRPTREPQKQLIKKRNPVILRQVI